MTWYETFDEGFLKQNVVPEYIFTGIRLGMYLSWNGKIDGSRVDFKMLKAKLHPEGTGYDYPYSIEI